MKMGHGSCHCGNDGLPDRADRVPDDTRPL
jgi:hypothetical protein